MRRIAIAMLIAASFCSAQDSGDFKPATSNVLDAQYPRVDSNSRAQIRIKAPDATKVRVNFWSGPKAEMQKEADGYWTFTTPRMAPGLHYYTLIVDGAEMSARRGAGAVVSVEADARDPAVLRVYATGLRYEPFGAVSGVVPPARDGGGRARVVDAGAGELHRGQPDREREGQAYDHRHGKWLCPARRASGSESRGQRLWVTGDEEISGRHDVGV